MRNFTLKLLPCIVLGVLFMLSGFVKAVDPVGDRIGVEPPVFNAIHIFDWNGRLLYKLITDQSYFRVWSDPVRKRLYTININTDEVYYLDLDELNQN